jgi:NTE family protein
LFEGSTQLFLASSNYNKNFSQFSYINLNIAKAFNFFDHLSILTGIQSGVKIGNTELQSLDFGLGGYGYNNINNCFSFYGYDYFSLSGESFTKTYATIDYEIFKNHHINASANFANIGEDLFLERRWREVLNYSGYAVGYGFETVFGPIELKYNWSSDTNYSAYLINVGYWF